MQLDPRLRRSLEDRMGADFSRVRIHKGPQAVEAAEAIDARAFTCGNDIVFNSGEYDPDSPEGQFLLAHELAHVKQQNGGAPISMMPQPDADLEIDPDPQLEREADQAAKEALSGEEPLTVSRLGTDVHIQRYAHGSTTNVGTSLPTDSPEQNGMWEGIDGKIQSFLADFSQIEFRLEPDELEIVAENIETTAGLYQFLEQQGIEATSDLEEIVDRPVINSWRSGSGSLSLLGLLGMGFTPAAAAAVLAGVSVGAILYLFGDQIGNRARKWLEARLEDADTEQATAEDLTGEGDSQGDELGK